MKACPRCGGPGWHEERDLWGTFLICYLCGYTSTYAERPAWLVAEERGKRKRLPSFEGLKL